MLAIKDLEIEVLKAGSSGVDFTIPGRDVEEMTFSKRAPRRRDEGTINLNNDDGTYSTSDKLIQTGDRLDVYVAPERSITEWGVGEWGSGGWAGSILKWSAWVEEPSYVRHGPTMSTLSIQASDYVFRTMANRKVFNIFEDVSVSGSEDAILDTVLSNETPELDTSSVTDVGENTSLVAEGIDVLEVAIKLARRTGSVLWGWKDKVGFESVGAISPEFTVDPASDIGTFTSVYKGSEVSNVVRVDGGNDFALDDETSHNGTYSSASSDSRLSVQVSTRKSQLDRVEIWTRLAGSQESVSVRLQKDSGGSPVAIGDTDSDIDSKQLSYEFLDDDGWTTFILNDHTLPEPNPWLIIETDGPNGQDIGLSASGDPAYKAHYPFPVSVQVRNGDSIDSHTRIETFQSQEDLSTLDAAREQAFEHLEVSKDPDREIEMPALTPRMHNLSPGDVVTFDDRFERERATGDYMVTEVGESYTDNTIHTTIKAQEVSTI